jgi:hypothetical protein
MGALTGQKVWISILHLAFTATSICIFRADKFKLFGPAIFKPAASVTSLHWPPIAVLPPGLNGSLTEVSSGGNSEWLDASLQKSYTNVFIIHEGKVQMLFLVRCYWPSPQLESGTSGVSEETGQDCLSFIYADLLLKLNHVLN